MSETFDETYFERGVEAHVSGYTDYRWRPEYVLPLAHFLKHRFNYTRVYGSKPKFLDYGCAKGFLVKALRLLDVEAYGYDISEYAIKNCEVEVKDYVSSTQWFDANIIIMKDVLEHMTEEQVHNVLTDFHQDAVDFIIAIIPLGDDNKFRIRDYELDVTHVTKKDEVWWINQFNQAGFICDEFYYSIPGIKDNWTSKYPYGNGIFIFRRSN